MLGIHSNQEVEIKLRVTDVSALRHLLKHLRAREICPRTHESNTLYDTPKRDLARRGQLIRIRIERPSSDIGRSGAGSAWSPPGNKDLPRPSKAVLTYKGPSQSTRTVQPATHKPRKNGGYKVREEVEVAISDEEQMRRILSALGLQPLFHYEKVRTTYTLPGVRNLKIDFDETPIGRFLELEGAPSAINRVAALLGYSRSDFITQTYGALYIADCRRHGRKPTDMLFPTTRKLH
jgi:adenylate cyclase class 2